MSFKVRLLLGAAAPFVLCMPAVAQVQITTATTAPVSTATASNGAPANIEITTAGSITLPAATGATAVTVNSSNTITNNGAIAVPNSDNGVGVRILPGFTTNYTGGGGITLLEDFTRPDTDSDGDLDGPVAQGTGRVGLLVDPGGTMTGNINATGGSITVEGNNSAGVSVRSALNGTYRQRGAVSVIGANSVGVELREDVSGDVVIGGTTSAQGEGSVGARVLGDVAGEFSVDGTIIGTGFTSTSVSNFLLVPNAETSAKLRDADDLLIGGPALEVRGNLAHGFLINGNAVGGTDPTDNVKDVVQDFNENRTVGSVQSFGSAPAVLLQPLDGAAGGQLHLGLVRESVQDTLDDDKDGNVTEVIGVFNYDFGFINRGGIIANGLNIGIPATALKIAGSADGTHQTIIDGGIFNGSQINATGFEADAVGLLLGAGASTPQLVNNGTISATLATQTTHDATAVLVQAGANLPSVINNTIIATNVRGYGGDTTAFRDLSGTVTSFRNNSRIVAGYTDPDTTDNITSGAGRAVALDLSHGAAAVTLTQTDAVDNARIFGDILFGAGSDRFDLLSGEATGKVDFGASGADTLNINSAKLFGDATFRGTNNTVSLVGSTMTGALALGGGNAALSFTGGSIYTGDITSTGGAVSMAVDNSTVNNSADGTLNLSSMSLTNNAKVGFIIDNARIAGNTPIFNVTGTANLAANTVFTPVFQEFLNQTFTLRVLNAGTLNLGGPPEQMLNAQSPYLFDVSLTRPVGTNALDLAFRVKNETELGLNTREAGAYDAVLDLMEQSATVGASVASLSTKNEFLRGWADLMPAPDAGVMRILASNSTAAFGATANRLDLISNKPDAPGGAWAEQFGVYHEADVSADALPYSGGGFGVAAGIDLLSSGTALIGAFASLESVEVEEQDRTAAPLNVAHTTLGLYGGWKAGNFAVNGAGGFGFGNFTSDRTVVAGTLSDELHSEWNGTTYNVAARATYTFPLGWVDLKPFIAADYMTLKQDAYQENATTLDDLELIASDSEATLATGSYGFILSGKYGSDDAFAFRPQLSVGYRNVLTWEPGAPEYHYAGNSAGTTFILTPGVIADDAIVAGLGLNIDSQFLNIKLGYDAEISDTAITHYGSITLRMAFW